MGLVELRAALLDAFWRADRAGASALLEEWSAEQGDERLVADVIEPVLREVGDDWREAEKFTVAQVYVAGKVAADALTRIAQRSRVPAAERKGPVVVGNVEDDFHSLGRRIVITFLEADGWAVRDLGNDVQASTFVDEALASNARVIGVSAMMLTTARNIRGVRAELDRRGLSGNVQLAVGGAVFVVQPDLVHEVGADGTATSALGAGALFTRLWQQAEAAGALP